MPAELGFEIKLSKPYPEAKENVIKALKSQGFGVLTQIDVRTTMKEKLGVEFPEYSILGACNPPLAYRALSADTSIGLLLPCNVTIEARPDGSTLVRLANPESMMTVGDFSENQELREVAQEARARIENVILALQA